MLMELEDSLPSADFNLESSDEESYIASERSGHQLQIFNRADHLKTVAGIQLSEGSEDEAAPFNSQDLVVEDVEGVNDISLNGRIDDGDIQEKGETEWNEFRSVFEGKVEEAEKKLRQEAMHTTVDRLKEEMLVNMISSLHSTVPDELVKESSVAMNDNHIDNRTVAVGLEENEREDSSTAKNKRFPSPKSLHKGRVLQSSRFDRMSESDLDTVLEAIEEESREGSISPPGRREPGFTWERVYHNVYKREEERGGVVEQLIAISKRQEKQGAVVNSVTNDHVHQDNEDIQWMSHKSASSVVQADKDSTVYLDLRMAQDEVFGEAEPTTTSKHFLKTRLASATKSSSDESDDPYRWKEERRILKESIANTGTTPSEQIGISSVVDTVVDTPNIVVVQSKKKQRNRRKPSSGSLSEDDLFVSSFEEGRRSPGNERTTPSNDETTSSNERATPDNTSSKGNNNNKKGGKNSKKKKRKNKGRKDSCSGSDGEGSVKTTNNNSNETNKKTRETNTAAVVIPKRDKRRGSRRLRHDSWPMSSDDDITGSPRQPSHYYSSEGENGTIDIEKVKQHLQRRIESRKPPFLFKTPLTQPVFHQDVSFVAPLPSLKSDTQPLLTLLLPLTNSGTISLPVNSCPSFETLHLLKILLTVWLMSLYREDGVGVSKGTWSMDDGRLPGEVGGFLQTIVDGSPCLLVGIYKADVNELGGWLDSCSILDVIRPLLALTVINSLIPLELNESLQSLCSSLPLSSLLSLHIDSLPLTTPLSFYWSSLYDLKCLPSDNSLRSLSSVQVTVCTVNQPCIATPELLFTLLHQAINRGLCIAGIRLAFQNVSSARSEDSSDAATLVIAFRGTNAIQHVMDIVGPDDHQLAKVTDPESLSAIFSNEGNSRPLISCVHSHFWAGLEIAKWFGGRACAETGSILGVSDAVTRLERRKRQRVRFSESESEDVLFPPLLQSTSLPDDIAFPPLVSNVPGLIAYSYSKLLFVVSPFVPPVYYATMFQSINECGFDVICIKRVRLNAKRATALKMPSTTSHYFTPSSAPSSPNVNTSLPFSTSGKNPVEDSKSHHPPLPSVVFVLGKESAHVHAISLVKTATSNLQRALVDSSPTDEAIVPNQPEALFYTVKYEDDFLKVLGSFAFTPTHSSTEKCCSSQLLSQPIKEEICVVSLIGSQLTNRCVQLMRSILNPGVLQDSTVYGPIELIGIKLIPELTRFHAKQIPSSGTLLYQDAVDHITGKVTLLLVLRGINVNERVSKVLKSSGTHQGGSSGLLRPSSEAFESFCTLNLASGFEMASLFFIDKELFSDCSNWALVNHVPLSWCNDCAILSSLVDNPENLLSMFTVPVDHIRLLVKVLDKLFRAKFTIAGMKLVGHTCTNKMDSSIKYSVAVCLQRYNAVWQLCHELRPFSASLVDSKQLKFPHSFIEAVEHVQCYFPCGVYASDQSELKYYQLPLASVDVFKSPSNQQLSVALSAPISSDSPFSEDLCLIIPGSLFSGPSIVSVLDILNKAGYTLTGLLMTQLSKMTAESICEKLECESEKITELTGGVCLVVKVTRDNGASCFETIVTSTIDQSSGIREDTSLIKTLMKSVIRSINHRQSLALMTLLFSV